MQSSISKRNQELDETNSELDLKTKILMKEIESLKLLTHSPSTSENNDDSSNVRSKLTHLKSRDMIDAENREMEITKKMCMTESCQQLKSKRNTSEAEVRFLQAKLKILTAEMERQQNEYRKKMSDWHARDGELRGLRDERDRLAQQVASLSHQVTKFSELQTEHAAKLQRLDAENTKLMQELQASKKEIKCSKQRSSNLELRLNKAIEENENMRACLRHSQLQEKESQEDQKRAIEQLTSSMQRVERQRNELVLAFRRQTLLCHNLQQQKDILIAGAAAQKAEVLFEQLLTTKGTS